MTLSTLIAIPLVAALLTVFLSRNRIRPIELVAVIATAGELFIAAKLLWNPMSVGGGWAHALLYLDPLGSILLGIITFVACNTALYSIGYLRAEMQKGIVGRRRVWQYWILFHLFVFAMLLSVVATSPMVMWAAIEATTLSTVFLVSFYNKPSSLEAGWKYLVVNSVGLLIGFFGTLTMLSLGEVPRGSTLSWSELVALAPTFDPLAVKIAFIFILVGYGTKVGLVPMHTWLPDAHGKAPAPISALLSGVLLNTAFLAIVRYKVVVDAVTGVWWSANMLLGFGILSVIVMGFMLLHQRRYKRLLAYSSIENMGILAIGFGFGGAGVLFALYHMLYHALVKSALFLSAGNLFLTFSSGKISNVRGIVRVMPWTGPLLFLGICAALGMPPFGTFVSKFGIVSSGIGAHPFLVGTILFGLALAFVGFLIHAGKMLLGEPPRVSVDGGVIPTGEHGVLTVVPIVVLLAAAIVLGSVMPQPLADAFSKAAHTYTSMQ